MYVRDLPTPSSFVGVFVSLEFWRMWFQHPWAALWSCVDSAGRSGRLSDRWHLGRPRAARCDKYQQRDMKRSAKPQESGLVHNATKPVHTKRRCCRVVVHGPSRQTGLNHGADFQSGEDAGAKHTDLCRPLAWRVAAWSGSSLNLGIGCLCASTRGVDDFRLFCRRVR